MSSIKSNPPIFCVETTDRVSYRKVAINFRASKDVLAPDMDMDEKTLQNEILSPTQLINEYKIPIIGSPIYWRKDNEDGDDNSYVIDIDVNDKFALSNVAPKFFMKHYLVAITMHIIEEKYNKDPVHSSLLGHELDLDDARYVIPESKLEVKHSHKIVKNKIVVVSEQASSQSVCRDDGTTLFDIIYRPKLMLLTCSLNIEHLPDQINFNDDRLIIMHNEKPVLDVHIPLKIDLSQEVKYKFDDKLNLFRIVLKVLEPPLLEYK